MNINYMVNYLECNLEVDMLNFTIHQSLCELIPDIKIGVICYDHMTIGHSPQMLKGRLQLFQESIYFELEDQQIEHYNEIKEWRTIFEKLGIDPNRYKHSTESLYRSLKRKKYLKSINSATDINHFFSLKYKIPIGIYDASKVIGNIQLRRSFPRENYEGLNGQTNQLESFLVTADDIGPFGSPFIDSKRTAITEQTTSAIQLVYLTPSFDLTSANELVQSLASMFVHINGGESSTSIVQCTK